MSQIHDLIRTPGWLDFGMQFAPRRGNMKGVILVAGKAGGI
jgi:hypothetical protein